MLLAPMAGCKLRFCPPRGAQQITTASKALKSCHSEFVQFHSAAFPIERRGDLPTISRLFFFGGGAVSIPPRLPTDAPPMRAFPMNDSHLLLPPSKDYYIQ